MYFFSFIQKIAIEQLLCVKYCARNKGSNDKTDVTPTTRAQSLAKETEREAGNYRFL